ncbi:GGDEF domain-containing response regulator [Anaerocolumna xylanovorans]|uniref:Stage 0 sporulation protein A homolog n=1 Tax=Anaerocolumna xylanovorans DSM 12503 TaxID=1121345 RepID=A0A1M7YF77_9FIRM|nr:diguanylate cyclase [Anaerocolumna xylanovorans]SHO51294.1 diguanylate cyclase (GGDEF) domain-containing protein [Anaerocolumna xylanovorans DSM 12503]
MEKDTVLVVDDSEIICTIIKDILESSSLHIAIAHSGEESIPIAKTLRPTLILLDIMMTGIDGYETCKILKGFPETKDIPIIFITGNNDSESVLRGFEVGAADYVSKPFIPEELKARVKVHMQNVKNQRELQLLMKELKEMAITDYLTKLYNRRYFMEKLHEYVESDYTEFALILFDVDNFKNINDVYGHNAGDIALVNISNIFRLILREEDTISRWGGEEFLVFLPNADIDTAMKIADKLRKEVERYTFTFESTDFHCTITGGVVKYDPDLTVEKNITCADQALYQGKSMGKNLCINYLSCLESM